MVALLPVESGLAAAVHCTVALPVPEPPDVIVSHG
jgi:hypothetical protein